METHLHTCVKCGQSFESIYYHETECLDCSFQDVLVTNRKNTDMHNLTDDECNEMALDYGYPPVKDE